jgi:NIMA (never in mitosis gene a)-related kinase 2
LDNAGVDEESNEIMRQVQMMARKEIDYKGMSTEQKKQLVSEVNILRELKHPNIVRYFDRFVDRENGMIYIMMEYCPHGDLAALIRKCKREKYSLFIIQPVFLFLYSNSYK